ncbi:MAG TPA: hypothetical protein VK034_06935 [Enhygromyxa sp.]|nr:hypothetical protein [Enhygromyxa sp.]
MQITIDGTPVPALQASLRRVAIVGEGVELAVELDADEELGEASLTLHKASGAPEPSWSDPVVASDVDGSLIGITWVSLDWGETRTIEKVGVALTLANQLGVRVKIAKGASQWFSPPGPTMTAVPNSVGPTTLTLSFPDTTADRLLIEFVAQGLDAFKTVSLTATPSVEFGPRARDVAIAARRSIFSLPGEPLSPVEVPGLLAALAEQKLALLGPTTIPLVLRAGSAGNLDLVWSFVADRLIHELGPPISGPRGELALGWAGAVELPLFQREGPLDPLARVLALELALDYQPAPERLLIEPEPALLDEKLAELVRPLNDRAQRVELAGPEQLTGVSLRVRPLSGKLELLVAVHADAAGSPAASPLVEVPVSIAEPDYAGRAPRWLEVDFPTPVAASGSAWIVVRSLVGELSWMVGRPKPIAISTLRHRRSEGAWLERSEDLDGWALLRLRALETGPIPPPTLELQLLTDGAHESHAIEWAPTIRWTPPSPAPAATAIVLRVASAVPATLGVADLTLRWRAVAPLDAEIEPDESLDIL